MDHPDRAHSGSYVDDYHALNDRPRTLDGFVTVAVDASAMNVCHWLDWVIMENHPLIMCERNRTRKYTSLDAISTPTLKKHMIAVEDGVQKRINECLNGKIIVLLIDARTKNGNHFVAVIAVTPSDTSDSIQRYLLCMSTLTDESGMGSDSTIELLDDVLDTYGIHARQLSFYVCDHASVNVALARKTSVPIIGCASHRLNLAAQLVIEPHSELLDKLNQLMVRLSSCKNRHYLREADCLILCMRNATRWSSTFSMVSRYLAISEKIGRFDEKLIDLTPTAREEIQLKALRESLFTLESVSKKLQSEGVLSLKDVRALFDHVVIHFPVTAQYLSISATVVKYPNSEMPL